MTQMSDSQHNAGYESASAPPLYIAWTDSPLGPIITVCDEAALYMIEFISRKNLESYIKRLQSKTQRPIIVGRTQITDQIEVELTAYFAKRLTQFQTPIHMIGTPFQKSVWSALYTIPYGQTRSYSELAQMSGNGAAIRAAASSNANNTLPLIIPCHRVIAKSGKLGGYAGGVAKKQWLLDLEAGAA